MSTTDLPTGCFGELSKMFHATSQYIKEIRKGDAHITEVLRS